MSYTIVIIALAAVALVLWAVHRQRSLRLRAQLMKEAVRNGDFTFRLPTNGLWSGERAMQETLNHLGDTIRQQRNQGEVEAWEQLTHVLTHEIMNATAPIASISQSLLGRDDVKGTPLEEGIRAIHTASSHLNQFVDSYRKLSQIQQPSMTDTTLDDMAAELEQLYPQLQWQRQMTPGLTVHTDITMTRQILINLTNNAAEAGARNMGLATQKDAEGNVALSVSNDGQPIPAEVRSSVFVPFFTTKQRGHGIGLSLCRRMMTLQGGWIDLAERPQQGYRTTFVLHFNPKLSLK